jgi:hypothetical protein
MGQMVYDGGRGWPLKAPKKYLAVARPTKMKGTSALRSMHGRRCASAWPVRRPARTGAWVLTLAVLLPCPSGSTCFSHLASPASRTLCHPAAACSVRAAAQSARRAGVRAVVICQEQSGEAAGSGIAETRAMDWDAEISRGASQSMEARKSMRVAQLRAQMQECVRNEQYAEAALLQEQLQALERTAVRSAFDQSSAAAAPRLSTRSSTALVPEDENMLSRTRGPMQRRPSRALSKTPPKLLTDRERARLDEQVCQCQ